MSNYHDWKIPEYLIVMQVKTHMAELGIPPRGDIVLKLDTSHIERYDVEGDKPGRKNGYYIIHTDGKPAWCIGSWKTGDREFRGFDESALNNDDRETYIRRNSDSFYMERVERERRAREARERERLRKAVGAAKREWDAAKPLPADFPYFKRKGVINVGDFRLSERGQALIPITNALTDAFMGYQYIWPEKPEIGSDKGYCKGITKTGGCYIFKPERSTEDMSIIFLCEGIATGDSVFRLAGSRYNVVCAMDASNLYRHVARMIKEVLQQKGFTNSVIVVCADNDHKTAANNPKVGNTGVTAGNNAVRLGYAKGMIYPPFMAHEEGSDWNDYEALHGFDAAKSEFKRQLDEVLSPPKEGSVAPDFSLGVDDDNVKQVRPVSDYLPKFVQGLLDSREGKAIPTGLKTLDKVLCDGLCPGLYFIGAISALGKTTLALQISDNIAKSGHGVMIFSLEMSRREMMAKTLSRESLVRSLKQTRTTTNALTTLEVLRAEFRGKPEQESMINQVLGEYDTWGRNLTIIEGIGNIGTSTVKACVNAYMSAHDGHPPVIVIDYLQIMAPSDVRASDKQNVDKNVLELKRLSREYEIPVICISSFNRENYSEAVSMAAFKESGAIEYGSDVLIGLQLAGLDRRDDDNSKDAYKRRVQKVLEEANANRRQGRAVVIEAKILKQRNGAPGRVVFEFYSRFNYFMERESAIV